MFFLKNLFWEIEPFGVGLAFYLLGVCGLGMGFWKMQSESWLGITAEDTTDCKAAGNGVGEETLKAAEKCWDDLFSWEIEGGWIYRSFWGQE